MIQNKLHFTLFIQFIYLMMIESVKGCKVLIGWLFVVDCFKPTTVWIAEQIIDVGDDVHPDEVTCHSEQQRGPLMLFLILFWPTVEV